MLVRRWREERGRPPPLSRPKGDCFPPFLTCAGMEEQKVPISFIISQRSWTLPVETFSFPPKQNKAPTHLPSHCGGGEGRREKRAPLKHLFQSVWHFTKVDHYVRFFPIKFHNRVSLFDSDIAVVSRMLVRSGVPARLGRHFRALMVSRLKNIIVTFYRGLKEIEKENGSCQHWNQVYCEAQTSAGGKGWDCCSHLNSHDFFVL